tara:strand:+ start:1183 stop:2226 length:1044 start_codon:yes stop_codon:yes gene_type:complete
LRKEFGGKITTPVKRKLKDSSNWSRNRFQNLVHTKVEINLFNLPGLLYRQFFKTKGRVPLVPIPIKKFDINHFLKQTDSVKFIWFGHSVILLNVSGKIIFIDPMMGSNASPVPFLKVKRFSINTLDILDQLPQIDFLLLSHDHYDHLGFESIQKLNSKVKRYCVSLGTKRHLVKWGVCDQKVKEFDWWDTIIFEKIEITFTPSRHSGGRALRDKDKTLWGGWVIKSEDKSLYFSGDGGYGNHFKTIGDKFGPFELGFMECGQYHKLWHQIHMFPNETVQAAIDAQVKEVIPVHWAGFALAQHNWKTPVDEFIINTEKTALSWSVPALGEIVDALGPSKRERWWDELL